MADAEPPFCSMIRASGLAEVWTHTHDKLKFRQFGWRTTTKDTAYENKTLVGNWNEDRFDIEQRKKAARLPSAYAHYFDTTYDKSYNKGPYQVPESLKNVEGRDPHAFPCHQPELDHQSLKNQYNSWETTQRTSFINPKLRSEPRPDKQ